MSPRPPLAALLLLSACGFARAEGTMRWSNTGDWKRCFSDADFSRPEIAALVEKLKAVPIPQDEGLTADDRALIEDIASRGGGALPYALKLDGDRVFYAAHAATFLPDLATVRRPYARKAAAIVSAVRDRAALPRLKRMIDDSDLTPAALEAYTAVVSSAADDGPDLALSTATIAALISARPAGSPEVLPAHIRLLSVLTPADALPLLRAALSGAPAAVSGEPKDHPLWMLDALSANDERRFARLLDAASALGSPALFRLLYDQACGLANASGAARRYVTDDGKARAATLGRLYESYLRALRVLAPAAGVDALVVPDMEWLYSPRIRDPRERWIVSFRAYSLKPDLRVVDASGADWKKKTVRLHPGAVFPYEDLIQAVLAPRSKWTPRDVAVAFDPASHVAPSRVLLTSYPENALIVSPARR